MRRAACAERQPSLVELNMTYEKYQIYQIKKRRITAKITLFDLYQMRIKACLIEFVDAK